MPHLSVLQAVDFGLGQHLAQIYSVGGETGPLHWQRLLQRPAREKIFRGDFETPQDVVRALESLRSHARQQGTVQLNAVNLPVVAYGRKAHIQSIEPEAAAHQYRRFAVTESQQQLRLALAMVQLEYTLMLLAWDRPTLDAMQLAWLFHVANIGARGHKFPLHYELDGEPLTDITAEIIDPKTVAFEDVSLTVQEGRLHAVRLPVMLRVYAIQGVKVSLPTCMRWQFELRICQGRNYQVVDDAPGPVILPECPEP